ncbi:MAG: hypothetical protein HY711_01555 [Candidatus Melainabacteria bacterium]|nr:hypothetical protein [Candidatus Melainabacteria bacterium]
MTKGALGLLCAFMVCAGGWLPGQAEEATGVSPGKSEPAQNVSDTKDSGVQLPHRLAAFVAGVVIGTPIAIVRKSYQQTITATRDIVGESTNPLFVLPAGALSLPYAVLGGTFEGAYTGLLNAWVNSADDPFGKDSFSLGEMQ